MLTYFRDPKEEHFKQFPNNSEGDDGDNPLHETVIKKHYFPFSVLDAACIQSVDNAVVSSTSRHRTFSAVDTLAAVATAEMASNAADWADALLAMCNRRGGDGVSDDVVNCRSQGTDSSADRQQSHTSRCCDYQETFQHQELEISAAPGEQGATAVLQEIVVEPLRHLHQCPSMYQRIVKISFDRWH